jgi:predicted RNA binding protein YcfA (HicA-like mRNA interferase family)
MAADPRPKGYRYDEAATVLTNLGFECAKGGGSHRMWRKAFTDGETRRTVVIGLLDAGRGTMKLEYVRDMVETLRKNRLLPDEV